MIELRPCRFVLDDGVASTDGFVVLMVLVLEVVVQIEEDVVFWILSTSYLLFANDSLMYPSAEVSPSHLPNRFRFSLLTPASTASVAAVLLIRTSIRFLQEGVGYPTCQTTPQIIFNP